MGLGSEVKRLYGGFLGSPTLRQVVLPVALGAQPAANAAGSVFGAWVDLALLATIAQESLVVQVVVGTWSAADDFTVEIGSTFVLGVAYANAAAVIAGGVAVIAAAARAQVRTVSCPVGATAVLATSIPLSVVIPIINPVYVPANTGLIVRCYGITAAAVTCRVSAVLLQGF